MRAKSGAWQAASGRSVDTSPNAPIKYSPRYRVALASGEFEVQIVTIVKLIIITIAVILTILFFGRFLF
ncbi:MAG TPA: hypothetical protein VIQ24_21025 [Pyrinomonadaceae bacterium]